MILVVGFLYKSSYAEVEGECDNCHIMYISQDDDSLDVGKQDKFKLITDCVGCHSADDSATWKNDVGAPIVFNRSAPQYGFDDGENKHGLAGGNFFWVTLDDSKGHNVKGIVSADPDYSIIPGASGNFSCGVADCHNVKTPLLCKSCHTPKHHADDSIQPVGYEGGFYRFLGHLPEAWPDDNSVSDHITAGVKGVEDPDWEKDPSVSGHNEYSGGNSWIGGWGNPIGTSQSMSNFCAGCHKYFHRWGNEGGTGTANPWLRHPTDITLPEDLDKEYQYYRRYNPQAPIARSNIDHYSASSSTVTPGIDQVQCLSCHRAHGSPYPDMLRWDYSDMQAGVGINTTGCFICHTSKATGR